MGGFSVETNIDEAIGRLNKLAGQFKGTKRGGTVINRTPYAAICEYGDSTRPPHAMVRGALPNVQAFTYSRVQKLSDLQPVGVMGIPVMDIMVLADRVLDYSKVQFELRTHILTGYLISNWRKEMFNG